MLRGWHRFRILVTVAGIGLGLIGTQPARAQYYPTYPACPPGYYFWPGYGCVVYPAYGYYYPPPVYYAPPPVFGFFGFGRGFGFHHHEFEEHEFHGEEGFHHH